jgi:hypothetical protein
MEKTMKQQLTTLGKVFDRVDKMSAGCYDLNIDVPDISFDNLDVLRIAGEPHSSARGTEINFKPPWHSLSVSAPVSTRCAGPESESLDHEGEE